MSDQEELDSQSLQMNLQYTETPIVFLKLETYDAFKELASACRALQRDVTTPTGEVVGTTEQERAILEALEALDRAK